MCQTTIPSLCQIWACLHYVKWLPTLQFVKQLPTVCQIMLLNIATNDCPPTLWFCFRCPCWVHCNTHVPITRTMSNDCQHCAPSDYWSTMLIEMIATVVKCKIPVKMQVILWHKGFLAFLNGIYIHIAPRIIYVVHYPRIVCRCQITTYLTNTVQWNVTPCWSSGLKLDFSISLV